MTDRLELLFAGRVFCDLVMSGVHLPRPGTEVFASGLALSPGGAATRAVAGARLGLPTGLVATIGTDPFGAQVGALLAAESPLDLTWLVRHPTAHTAVSVAVANADDRSFISYEEPEMALTPDPGARLGDVGACHVGLVEGVPDWVRRLRDGGTVVVGGVGWDDGGAWAPEVLDRLAEVDVCVPNEQEALNYTRTDDVATAAAALAERVPVVCVTRGPAGAYALDRRTGERVEISAPPTIAVDPTGAGDVFVAAFMAGTTLGWDLATRTTLAVCVASRSVRTPGGAAGAPRRADLGPDLSAQRDRTRGDGGPAVDWPTLLHWART